MRNPSTDYADDTNNVRNLWIKNRGVNQCSVVAGVLEEACNKLFRTALTIK